MKLKNKMILSTGLSFTLFILALTTALTGMQNAKSKFETFLDRDQALLQAETAMYAQGLQMGQALRNIVMDPANKTAYKNLDGAAEEFRQAHERALSLVGTDPSAQKMLQEIGALRAKQAPLQARVVAAAALSQADAIALISKEETPVWRDIRGRLLDAMKAKDADVVAARGDTISFTRRMLVASIALALLAVTLGGATMYWLGRNVMKQLGGEPDYAARIAADIAAGNFSTTVNLQPGDRSSLLCAMDAMRQKLSQTVREIKQSADTIDTAAREIAAGNADLSARTESQASSLEETASSMEELTSAVRQNADNAQQANQLAASASEVAAKGGEVVEQVVETMESIKDSSRRIADIIGVIDGIAFQTNILALNAAVEAARAGEQGRGFAVVAGEVRSLAQRSAAAAKEIKDLIGDSVDKVEAGGRLVETAGSTMAEIMTSVRRVTDIMGEITAASQEQSAGIVQVNQAVGQMDEVTQQNSALVEEAAAAAQSLRDQSARLARLVAGFTLSREPMLQLT
ncbi:MAG TPA: methyl-accepting chemotaxis protein [Noviherbaspirillum sp.]|nr:methyl-accepting chemotaxis protein [Noviherbaspirillum sp.]